MGEYRIASIILPHRSFRAGTLLLPSIVHPISLALPPQIVFLHHVDRGGPSYDALPSSR